MSVRAFRHSLPLRAAHEATPRDCMHESRHSCNCNLLDDKKMPVPMAQAIFRSIGRNQERGLVPADAGVPVQGRMAGTEQSAPPCFVQRSFCACNLFCNFSRCSIDAWRIAVRAVMRFILQEWEPYEADLAVPMTGSDLSLKVPPLPSSHTLQQLHGGVTGSLALLHRVFSLLREG